ncbi:ferredoxin:thioredoxin reductase [Candidatus Woesearchaeota archaeon]|nr:ferredoxin:thioredoxin reductase [Candidatus Woesearchaeota archaeon]
MNKQELFDAWKDYCKGQDFKLNNEKHVFEVIDGVLENEKMFGLKLCPCRLRDGTKERDLELLCPCNFQPQKNWKEKGECWCGLFVKR